MAWLSAPSGDFSDLHGRFQHLSLILMYQFVILTEQEGNSLPQGLVGEPS